MPTVTDEAAFGVPDASGMDEIWAAVVVPVPIDEGALNEAVAR
jgi:hypothetical protein